MNVNQIFTIICQNKSRLLVKGGKGKGDFFVVELSSLLASLHSIVLHSVISCEAVLHGIFPRRYL